MKDAEQTTGPIGTRENEFLDLLQHTENYVANQLDFWQNVMSQLTHIRIDIQNDVVDRELKAKGVR